MACSEENLMVLNAKEAAYLITKRECLEKLILSIKGTITALSDMIRVGKDQMFLIELDRCIFLVVKDSHLDWHTELAPGDVFVFHGLRLTTLNKGISETCSVFLVLATSSLKRLADENDVTPMSLQEWLKKKNITGIPTNVDTLGCGADSEKNQELVNYEGVVTSTEMASSGVFVLDGKLRLISVLNNVNLIKKHNRIFIYNAHLIKDGSQPYLMCCMKSCIRIQEPVSSAGEVEEPADNKVRIFIQNLIRKYGLNFREITALIQLYSALARIRRSRSSQDNVFAHFIKKYVCKTLVENSVKATDIFIYHDQLCPFNQPQSDGCRIPQVMDLYSLKRETTSIQSAVDSNNCSLAEAGLQLQSSPHHLKLSSPNGKVLIGCILTCSERTVFQDDTASLGVIILPESDDTCSDRQNDGSRSCQCPRPDRKKCDNVSHHEPHLCCQCCLRMCQLGTRLICPVLDAWVIGKTICVTRFHTVVEYYHDTRTLDSKTNGDDSFEEDCMYLAFSLLDCVLLDLVENNPTMTADSSPASTSSSCNPSTSSSRLLDQGKDTRKRKCDTESTCYIYIHEKQPLIYTGNQSMGLRTFQFRIVGSVIDLDSETRKSVRCRKICENGDTNSENLSLEAEVTKQETSLAEANKQDLAQQNSKSICASFSDLSSKWYSCISNDHLYKFMSKSNNNCDPFKPKFSQVQLQKVAEHCNMRLTIEMPKDLLAERLPLTVSETCMGFADVHVLHSIGQILSESFSETIVSFQGVIAYRNFAESFTSNKDKQGMQSQSMTCFKLEVKEIVPHKNESAFSTFGITLYFDAPRTVYTLGLVPGAVVKFHRVERKVSKAGNIYCRFNTISMAEVVKFHVLSDVTSGKFLMSQTRTIAPADLSRELLINIWQKDSQREDQIFRIHCHIDKIFRLCIKLVCPSCKSMYLKQGCERRGCTSLALPLPVASAVLLVEDGTCPAIVKIWSSDLVCLLLGLTSGQWEDLLVAVKEHGEVLINYATPLLSSVAIFLHALIESSMILRTCKMAVRRSKGSGFLNFDKMLLEDFQEKEVRIGKQVLKTLSLPRMNLDCLAISELD